MFSGLVVTNRVGSDQLLSDRDLNGAINDSDLDLAPPVLRPGPVVGASETHVA